MTQSLATPPREQVDAAIRQTGLDYLEGWNDGDPVRMERSIHPNLAKRIVRPNDSPPTWPPGDRLDEMSALRLVQLTRHEPVPEYSRSTRVQILDRFANAASVKLGRDHGEYDHLALWNGRWVIVNVLWGLRPKGPGEVDEDAAITRTALGYIESCYEGDGEKIAGSLHPSLAKRIVIPGGSPPTSTFPGDRLDELNGLALVRLVARPENAMATAARGRRADITILDRCANAASVRIDASTWIEYLHLCKWNGRWAIVNVLWARRPKTEMIEA